MATLSCLAMDVMFFLMRRAVSLAAGLSCQHSRINLAMFFSI